MKLYPLVFIIPIFYINFYTFSGEKNQKPNLDTHIEHYVWFEKLLAHLNHQPAYELATQPTPSCNVTQQGLFLEIDENNYAQAVWTPWGRYKLLNQTDNISKLVQTNLYKKEVPIHSYAYILKITQINADLLPDAQESLYKTLLNPKVCKTKKNIWQYLCERQKWAHAYDAFEKLYILLSKINLKSESSFDASFHRTQQGFIIEADEETIKSIYTPWGKINLHNNIILRKKLALNFYKEKIYKDDTIFQSTDNLYELTEIKNKKLPKAKMISNVADMNLKSKEYIKLLSVYNKLPHDNLQDLCIKKIARNKEIQTNNSYQYLSDDVQKLLKTYITLNFDE